MSKQKLKRVRVKLKDITVCTSGPHYARWDYKGVFQKWLSKAELAKILRLTEKDKYVSMRLVKQLKKTRRSK
mgnify:CR=1 FL=1